MDLSTMLIAMAMAVAINVITAVVVDVAKGMVIALAVIADIATDIGSICVDVVKGVAVVTTMAINIAIITVIDIIKDVPGGTIVAITIAIDIIKCVAIVISRGMTIAIVVVVAIFDSVAAAIAVALGIVIDAVIGATVLWIIIAPICLPKTEESSATGESGMFVHPFFALDTDHLPGSNANAPPSSASISMLQHVNDWSSAHSPRTSSSPWLRLFSRVRMSAISFAPSIGTTPRLSST